METTPEQLRMSLRKAKTFILEQRDSDGSWTLPKDSYKLPAHYQTVFVKTCNACRALLSLNQHLSQKERGLVEQSLYQALTAELPADSPIDHHALRLFLCSFSNTEYAQKARQESKEIILASGTKGFWETYSNTYHFTNYFVLEALQRNNLEPPNAFTEWAMGRRTKNGDGWGIGKEDPPEPSPTATILLCCIFSGASVHDPRIKKVVDWLEKVQQKNGGWVASKNSDPHNSTYHTTGLATLCLLLATQDPTSRSVQKGIKFLLDGQENDGGWCYSTEKKKKHLFTQFYVVETLSFLLFILEAKSPQYSFLKGCLSPEQHYLFLYSDFVQKVRNAFFNAPTEQIFFTRALGSTKDAQKRRRDILLVLSERGLLDDAEVIDSLKERKRHLYGHLRKKDHLTLIKNDLRYLLSLNLIQKKGHKHFLVTIPPSLRQNI